MTSAVSVIAMVASKIALLALGILVAKFITKRMNNKKADRLFLRIHRKTAYVLLAAALTHGAASLLMFGESPLAVYMTGCTCLLAIAVAIATFLRRKKLGNKWQRFHRATTAIALVTLVLHLILRA